MDLATHALAGMAVGAAAGWKLPLVPALVAGVAASVLPDVLDVWLYPLDLEYYRLWHRVFTHSVFSLPPIALLAAAVAVRVTRSRRGTGVRAKFSLLPLAALAAGAVGLHLGLDLLCDWPLRLLYPVSRRDFALGLVNYSHPGFTAAFSALAVSLLLYHRRLPGRRLPG